MTRLLLLFFLCHLGLLVRAQEVYKITYFLFQNNVEYKDDPIIVYADKQQSVITRERILNHSVNRSYEESFIFNEDKTILKRNTFLNKSHVVTTDSLTYNRFTYNNLSIDSLILNLPVQKAKLSINSNAIELLYTSKLGVYASPNEIGLPLGLVLEYKRNGNSGIRAVKVEKLKTWPKVIKFPKFSESIDLLSYKDLVWRSKFIHIPIFNNERIRYEEGIQSDSVLRFANGTVILKKIKVPSINYDGQAFIQLVEKASGDAYDRTGSIFLIADDQKLSFLDGMKNGVNTLPLYDAGDSVKYLGMHRTNGYSPIYELMRFFTPFGVSHFNKGISLKGKNWQDSVIYRQDITEFLSVMAGKEVYIGTYIGNYDKGGHTVSLELTVHPGSSNYGNKTGALSLFNTTNVMEMGGQTYATLFGQEKGLTFDFVLDKDIKNARLRYITTGHGGWWHGDEFVPKVNSIFIDEELVFRFTPWRVDCGSYRLYNPASGNFESGLSSSDLSRSNWCPGTITYPVYIDLGDLKAGKHQIKIHIPQGKREGESFSFWNVSGALLFDL